MAPGRELDVGVRESVAAFGSPEFAAASPSDFEPVVAPRSPTDVTLSLGFDLEPVRTLAPRSSAATATTAETTSTVLPLVNAASKSSRAWRGETHGGLPRTRGPVQVLRDAYSVNSEHPPSLARIRGVSTQGKCVARVRRLRQFEASSRSESPRPHATLTPDSVVSGCVRSSARGVDDWGVARGRSGLAQRLRLLKPQPARLRSLALLLVASPTPS